MKCPKCYSNLIWYKVLRISRWTSIECPQCKALLNRSLNLQVAVVLLIGFFVLLAVFCLILYVGAQYGVMGAVISGLFLLLPWALAIAYLDSKTMRLVPVKRQKGCKALLGHKSIGDNDQ